MAKTGKDEAHSNAAQKKRGNGNVAASASLKRPSIVKNSKSEAVEVAENERGRTGDPFAIRSLGNGKYEVSPA